VGGVWKESANKVDLVDPMNGKVFLKVSNANDDELKEISASVMKCPKSGMHNPLKNVERYTMYGEIMMKMSIEMNKPDVIEFVTKLIQRVAPQSEFRWYRA